MPDAQRAYQNAQDVIRQAADEGLREIRLAGVRFHGLTEIPKDISKLTDLRVLKINETDVTDLTPIASLTRLHTLDLSRCCATDLAPIAGLSGLRRLYLDDNLDFVQDISPLSQLTDLERLSLQQCFLTDLTPLSSLTNLTYLNLKHTRATDISALATLSKLEHLWLPSGTEDISALEGLTRLLQLDLSGPKCTSFAALSGMVLMRSLNLSNSYFRDLSVLSDHSCLTNLNLNSTYVEDLGPLRAMVSLIAPVQDRRLGRSRQQRLQFRGTPAVQRDQTLARIAEISSPTARALALFLYLDKENAAEVIDALVGPDG